MQHFATVQRLHPAHLEACAPPATPRCNVLQHPDDPADVVHAPSSPHASTAIRATPSPPSFAPQVAEKSKRSHRAPSETLPATPQTPFFRTATIIFRRNEPTPTSASAGC